MKQADAIAAVLKMPLEVSMRMPDSGLDRDPVGLRTRGLRVRRGGGGGQPSRDQGHCQGRATLLLTAVKIEKISCLHSILAIPLGSREKALPGYV